MGRIMAVKVRLSEVPARQARRAARVWRMAQRRRLYQKFVGAQGPLLGVLVLGIILASLRGAN